MYGLKRSYVKASRKKFTYRLGNSPSGRAYVDPAPTVAVLVQRTAYREINSAIGLMLETTAGGYLIHHRLNYGQELVGAVVVLEPVPLRPDSRRDEFLEHLWRIKE